MAKLINKKTLIWVTILGVVGVLFGGSVNVLAEGDYGAQGAKEVENYTLEDMLIYAIQDEYLARAEYELIMEEYGEQRPFSNIIEAEEYHIELLKPLFEKYNIEIPADTSEKHVVVAESLETAFKTGVQAEIDNIGMYEKFLEKDLTDDVKNVFEKLMRGSENHLTAFERGLKRPHNGKNQ